MTFTDAMTLAEARDELRGLVLDGGHPCPCCTQLAKVYRRTIHATMARSLIVMYRRSPTEIVHLPSLFPRRAAADVPKLRHWGLIEEEAATREDGGRAGYWRVTPTGGAFVRQQLTVPKYAHVYDNRLLSLQGADVSVVDCLGKRFDYRELMNA